MQKTAPKHKIALALDNQPSLESVAELVAATSESVGVYKVGLELFTRFGPQAIAKVRAAGGERIFLDIKLHDIPNTVAKAVRSAAELGVDYLTLHTQGGSAMMRAAAQAAKEAAGEGLTPPKLIGVTILTSISPEQLRQELGVERPLPEQAARLAEQAVAAGLDGIVCSAQDLGEIRPRIPANFTVITPGIRMAGGATHDQARVATPASAIQAGATLLVVGRAITAAENPAYAAAEICREIGG